MWSWKSADPQADVRRVTNRIVSVLGGKAAGKWWTECELLHESSQPGQGAQQEQKELYVVGMSDTEDKFLVYERSVLQAGAGIMRMLVPLRRLQSRLSKRIDGSAYEVGDFVVRLGNVTVGSSVQPTQLVLEVEYRPCVSAGACAGLVEELLRNLVHSPSPPAVSLLSPPYADYGLGAEHSHRHTALEYVLLFMAGA